MLGFYKYLLVGITNYLKFLQSIVLQFEREKTKEDKKSKRVLVYNLNMKWKNKKNTETGTLTNFSTCYTPRIMLLVSDTKMTWHTQSPSYTAQ